MFRSNHVVLVRGHRAGRDARLRGLEPGGAEDFLTEEEVTALETAALVEEERLQNRPAERAPATSSNSPATRGTTRW